MHTTASHPIYCHPAYAEIQQYQNYFRCDFDKSVFCFDIINQHAFSLPKSPIGGISCLKQDETHFIDLWSEVENQLRKKGVKKVIVTNAPDFYEESVDEDWWFSLGFQKVGAEISHQLELNKPLIAQIHQMEKRILSKPATFEISEEPLSSLKSIHQFISDCRIQQNLKINIDFNTLQKLFTTFPESYRSFAARDQGRLIAALVMVQVNSRVAYYFLPATDRQYRSLSPMVYLMQWAFDFYARKGMELIDLGISSQNGRPQQGLIAFKERMGGKKAFRQSYSKLL